MKRKFKFVAMLTLFVGLSSFLSSTFSKRVLATADETVPTLETVTIDKNLISKNGALMITVKAYDNGTGIAGGDVSL